MIKLSSEVQLTAAQFATQGNAILGLRGSGKSYTATGLAEHLMNEKVPFTAFDPIGVWRNLKLPGKGPGFPVVVVGDDADLPLNQAAIPDIVRAAMREGVNLVIDLYSIKLSKAAWRDIVEQAITIMLHENKSHGLRHIFMEEAAEFCPQNIGPDQGKVYAAVEKLARMGGNASLGYTLINQRAEAVNKEVLENCDMVFLHKQRGRNSITNLGKWLKFMSPDKADEVMASLPNLKAGECWVLSADSDIPKFVKVPAKSSFHPDRQNPTAVKPHGKTVDVSGWIQRLSDSIKKQEEKAKPAQKTAEAPRVITKEVEKIVEVPVLSDEDRSILIALGKQLNEIAGKVNDVLTRMDGFKQRISVRPIHMPRPLATHTPKQRFIPTQSVEHANESIGDQPLSKGLRKLLSALASAPAGLSQIQLAVLSGVSQKSSAFTGNIALSRRNGWMDGQASLLRITEAGKEALGDFEELPTGKALLDYWSHKLDQAPSRILNQLAAVYPNSLTQAELSEHTGYSQTSSGFTGAIARLRALKLITGTSAELKASDEFFE